MDEKEKIQQNKKRKRAKRRKQAGKNFLIFISILIIAVAAFLITMKVCDPEFDIKSLIPEDKAQQVVSFVKEDILKQTTTTETTTQTTTKPTTTKPKNYDYTSFDDFAFDTSLQGNQVGNLLNKSNGSVTYSSSYIYYSIAGSGLYRFEPNAETYASLVAGNYNFTCLNVLGDYIYMVDADSNKLKKAQIVGGDTVNIADNIDFAYLYNDKIYYIGTDSTVGYINLDSNEKTVLYQANSDKEVSFVGISLSRIFFTTYDDVSKYYEYITVDLDDKSDRRYFRDDTKNDDIINIQLECGYFYYYEKQSDDSYNLCRQKFGSEQVVTLVENCSLTDYPVVYANRLYYTAVDGNTIQAREYNMNSKADKLIVYDYNPDDVKSIGVGYGYQYVFLFGSSQGLYKGSCIYTSASKENAIYFNNGKWQY
jgi:hypothetical protein